VTFIHGIANKPPKETLLEQWMSSLTDGGLDLEAEGVSASMVYWADVVYPEPQEQEDAYEAVDAGLGTDDGDEDLELGEMSDDEAAFIAKLREKLGFDAESPEGDDFTPPPPDEETESLAFEAVPLPWFVKRRLMKRLLKDVYLYLFNKPFSPRPGETYVVQDHIRRLFVDQLNADAAANSGGKHVVVSHSMGTVISYDCLKRVTDCPPVDNYMTVGCPLGISEVYDNLKPEYTRNDGFPSGKVPGEWVNVYDRLDPVAFDAKLANDYQKQGQEVILDQGVENSGTWRHSSWKYFGQESLCDHLRRLLDL
jgi:hypothetical protein